MALGTRTQARPPAEAAGSKRLAFATAVLALLTAIFGVLSAYLGVQAAQLGKQQKEAEVAAQSAGAQASSLQAQNGQLQSENDELQTENTQLRSQLGAPTASTQPGPEVSVRHAAKVTIAAGGSYIDLDAPSPDVQWGTTGASGGSIDLGYRDNTSILGFNARYINFNSAKVDYDACRTRTGYTNVNGYPINDITPGTNLCFQTSDSRFAAVKVLAIDNQSVTLDVVTYDPPFR